MRKLRVDFRDNLPVQGKLSGQRRTGVKKRCRTCTGLK